MNETSKNAEFIIPKGYKGIKEKIIFSMNSTLAVITGLNGSGKTTLLKYIFEQNKNKDSIFLKTQSNENAKKDQLYSRGRLRERLGYHNSSAIPAFPFLYSRFTNCFPQFRLYSMTLQVTLLRR